MITFEKIIEKFPSLFTQQFFPAKTSLLKESETSQKLFFIKEGSLRIWFNKDGVDLTLNIFTENHLVSSAKSFLSGVQSEFSIETIEPSTVYILDKRKFDELISKDHEFCKWVIFEMQNRFSKTIDRLLSFIKDSPKERYNALLKNHPEYLNRFPQYYIASYLGITGVSLSRIKNRRN